MVGRGLGAKQGGRRGSRREWAGKHSPQGVCEFGAALYDGVPVHESTSIDVGGTGILESAQSHSDLQPTSNSHTQPITLSQPCLLSGLTRPVWEKVLLPEHPSPKALASPL